MAITDSYKIHISLTFIHTIAIYRLVLVWKYKDQVFITNYGTEPNDSAAMVLIINTVDLPMPCTDW